MDVTNAQQVADKVRESADVNTRENAALMIEKLYPVVLRSEIERLRKALGDLASYALTVRTDRRQNIEGNIMCSQTEDWCNGLIERARRSRKTV